MAERATLRQLVYSNSGLPKIGNVTLVNSVFFSTIRSKALVVPLNQKNQPYFAVFELEVTYVGKQITRGAKASFFLCMLLSFIKV